MGLVWEMWGLVVVLWMLKRERVGVVVVVGAMLVWCGVCGWLRLCRGGLVVVRVEGCAFQGGLYVR